jgi:hypothetical protein
LCTPDHRKLSSNFGLRKSAFNPHSPQRGTQSPPCQGPGTQARQGTVDPKIRRNHPERESGPGRHSRPGTRPPSRTGAGASSFPGRGGSMLGLLQDHQFLGVPRV